MKTSPEESHDKPEPEPCPRTASPLRRLAEWTIFNENDTYRGAVFGSLMVAPIIYFLIVIFLDFLGAGAIKAWLAESADAMAAIADVVPGLAERADRLASYGYEERAALMRHLYAAGVVGSIALTAGTLLLTLMPTLREIKKSRTDGRLKIFLMTVMGLPVVWWTMVIYRDIEMDPETRSRRSFANIHDSRLSAFMESMVFYIVLMFFTFLLSALIIMVLQKIVEKILELRQKGM